VGGALRAASPILSMDNMTIFFSSKIIYSWIASPTHIHEPRIIKNQNEIITTT
jgi:hypothetical protein